MSEENDGSAESRLILGMRVDATSYADASERILAWAKSGESRIVCVAAVNNVMVAQDDPAFLAMMNDSDLVTPDGMPLVWGLRALGIASASRVYGPELTPVVLTKAAERGVPIGLLGGTDEVLDRFIANVSVGRPGLRVAYRFSPPFQPATPEEERRVARDINASGARIVFVGLGCPKQEAWMACHRGDVQAAMIGVGAAFDFLAGVKPQAPAWLRRSGLEWFFRLVTEPRRLWKRYLSQNPRFVLLFATQLLAERTQRVKGRDLDRQEAR